MTHINRGGRSLRTLEDAADDESTHIQDNRIQFQRGERNGNKGKNSGTGL